MPRHQAKEAHPFGNVLLWLLELCVIVGSVVFVAGAFLCAGRGNRQVLRLKYNPKHSAGVEISAVTRQGLNLNVHSHGTIFAPSTEMIDTITRIIILSYRRIVVLV